MNNKNMTALVSCFARAYHHKHYQTRIFDDFLAEQLLTAAEYQSIADNMAAGISYFNRDFVGSQEEALKWIVENQLAPTTLARSAFAEAALEVVAKNNKLQYLIFASGYDTYAYRHIDDDNCVVFEIDQDFMIDDKVQRLSRNNIVSTKVNYLRCDFSTPHWEKTLEQCPAFDSCKLAFCSLLGISYYLTKEDFTATVKKIAQLIPVNSQIVFDYPFSYEDEKILKQSELAKAASEEMRAHYSCQDIEELSQNASL